MKKNRNKKIICLGLAAFAMVSALTVGSVMAYFTAFDTAAGGVKLELGFTQTDPNEKVADETKELTLTNTGDFDCYVRLKALTGDRYKDDIRYVEPSGEGKWTPGEDGYYYYSDILAPGETTSQLNVNFVLPEEEPADFNVIIIQECTPVLRDESGNPYADWNAVADIGQSIYE